MKNVFKRIDVKEFNSNENASVGVEYGMIAAGIFLAVVSVIGDIGTSLSSIFNNIGNVF